MFETLIKLDDRYAELKSRMEQPAVYSDADAYAKYARELREIEPVVLKYREFARAQADREAALALMDDPEMKALAKTEYDEAGARADALAREL
ncbi:MAG TPA: PCRF domain-containing protein, partial [Oscillospiraceae bacterium]|nr:PCRF domain-containing protein [Oscillospiraceae bacterium]